MSDEFFAANIGRALLNARFGDGPVERITARTVHESLVPSVLPVIEEEVARRCAVRLARLRAVAEAARALHGKTDIFEAHEEWSALGAALKALDGGDR